MRLGSKAVEVRRQAMPQVHGGSPQFEATRRAEGREQLLSQAAAWALRGKCFRWSG